MALDPFNGPIPGENFTADTKNYPWHRPPEYIDLDDAIEACATQLMAEETSFKILTMVEMKLPIVRIADIFVTEGMYQGKWTPDVAIMLAGPITHIIKIMADGYGIKDYNLGLKGKNVKPKGKNFYKELASINEDRAALAAAGVSPELSGIVENAEDTVGPEGSNPQNAEGVKVQRTGGFMGGRGSGVNPMSLIADEAGANEQATDMETGG